MAKDYINTGLLSREHGVTAVKNLWKKADKLPIEEGAEYQWWPIEVINPDIRFSPRTHGRTNEARVDRYAELIEVLPPITVNADGRLIDGKHRIEAHQKAGENFIKVIVLDLPEHEIFERAYKANAEHGESYTDRERVADARRIWDARVAALGEGEKMNQQAFATEMGISRMTINRWLQDDSEEAAKAKAEAKAAKEEEKARKKADREAKAEKAAKDDGFHDVDEDDRPTFRGVTAPQHDDDDDWDVDDETPAIPEVFRRVAAGVNAINELMNESGEIEWDYHLQLLDVGGMDPEVIESAAQSLMKLSVVIQTGLMGQAEAEEEAAAAS